MTKALSAVGINPIANGQLRDLADVMDEVGAKWDTLDKKEKAYLATTMFGTHQRNRGITLMNNYNDSLKNYENALNSAGTAEQKFNIYQESTQAHIDSFKASMDNLWQNTFKSDMFKGIIDGASKLIDTFNELVKNPMTKFIAIAIIGATVGNGLVTMFAKMGTSALAHMIAVTKMSYSLVGLSSTIEILSGVMLASPLFWGAAGLVGIYAISKAIDYLTVSFKEQQETVETLSSNYQSITSDISSINSELETTQTRLDELNSQGTLTIVEEDEKRKLEETNTELERQLRIKESLERIKKAELQDATIKLLKMESETVQTGNKVLKQTGAKTAQLVPETKSVTKLESVDYNIKKLQELEQVEKDLQSQQDNLDKKSKDYDKTNAKLGEQLDVNAKKQSDVKTALSETAEYLSKQAENLDTTTDSGKKYKNQIDDTIVSIDEMINGLSTDKMPDWYDKNIKANKDMINSFKEDYDIDLNNYDNLADAKKDIEILATKDVSKILDGRIAEMNAKYDVDVKNYANATEAKMKMEEALRKANAKNSKGMGVSAGLNSSGNLSYNFNNPDLTSKQKKDIANTFSDVDTTSDYQSALDEINKIYGTYKSKPSSGGENTNTGDKDKKSKSTPSPIDPQDMASAFLKSANAQAEIDKFQAKSIERQIKVAESAKDYTKELELQDKLLENQNKQIADYLTANQKISNEATRLRSNSIYGEQSKNWFDVNGEATADYINLLESFAGKTDKASKAAYDNIKDLFDSLYTLKKGWYDNIDAVYELQDAISSTSQKQQEILEDIANARKDALSEQKDGIQTIIDLTEELIKKEKEDEKKAIQDNIDKYKNYIALRKEALDITEKEKSYQDQVNDKTKDISKLQEQADTLGLDDSREAQTQRADLLKQIKEKQEELNQYQHDDAVEKQQSALDKQLDAFEKEKDEEIDEIEDYLNKTGQLTRDAMRRIDAEGQSLFNDLIDYNAEYGNQLESTLTNAWASATKALEDYGSTLNAVTSMQSEITSIESASKKKTTSNVSVDSKDSIISQMQANSKAWLKANATERVRLSNESKKLGASIGAVYDSSTGKWYTDSTKKIPLFHNGLEAGFVGGNGVSVTPKQNELLALLKDDELVINPEQQLSLLAKLNPFQNIVKPMDTSGLSNITNNSGGVSLTIQVPVTITGNADSNAIAQLEKVVTLAADKALDKLNTQFNNRGVFKNVAFSALKG